MGFRKSYVYVLLLLLVFGFGCVKITVEDKIYPDGSHYITTKMDMKKLYELSKSFDENLTLEEFDKQMRESSCANVTQNSELINPKCDVKGGVVTISGMSKEKLTEEDGFRVEDGFIERYYILETTNPFYYSNEGPELPEGIGENISEAKSMGMGMKLIIEMPGEEIVETTGKEVGKTRVEYDVFDLLEEEGKIYIKTKEVKMESLALLGVLVVILLIGVYFFFIKKD